MFNKLLTGKSVILLVALMAILFFAGQADAQTKIAGKMSMSYTKMDSLVIGDAAGHTISLAESKGTNASVGETAFLDGAETTDLAFTDLMIGNGPQQGYSTFQLGDDMTMVKWQGQVTTTMTDEGAPMTTFNGNWEFVKGFGQYQDISGKGTYQGQVTSKTEYTVEWQGEYTLK